MTEDGYTLHHSFVLMISGLNSPFPFSQTLNWALQIAPVRGDDAGRYECQATTHPPQSVVVRLRVVGKRPLSRQVLFAEAGSALSVPSRKDRSQSKQAPSKPFSAL